MAGLVPAISFRMAQLYPPKRDHRDSALRAGPVMTNYVGFTLGARFSRKSFSRVLASPSACAIADISASTA